MFMRQRFEELGEKKKPVRMVGEKKGGVGKKKIFFFIFEIKHLHGFTVKDHTGRVYSIS